MDAWLQLVADPAYVALYPLRHSFGVVDPVRLGVLAPAVQRGLGEAPVSPQAASRLMLRGGSPCDVRPSAVTLAPFRFESLSLPDDARDCPGLETCRRQRLSPIWTDIVSECWGLPLTERRRRI